MGNIYNDITETIGHTPLVRLNRIGADLGAEFLVKLESFNPMGSLKDRIGLAMIEKAEKDGLISKGGKIVEATSGNTGISLAFVCAAKGYHLVLTMPENMSIERRKLLQLLGAEVVLTPAIYGMKGAIDIAEKRVKQDGNSFMPSQFANPANPDIHACTTAEEILSDTDNKLDVLVAGVGTGGSLTGITRRIKQDLPNLTAVGVEPANSAVLSGGMPGPHLIQGIGAGFIPPVLDLELIDKIVDISDQTAVETAQLCAKDEGIACGISSGAAVAAALKLAKEPEHRNSRFVIILPDFAERYFSTPLFMQDSE
ncbi:MAG: cysteine synthase A [Magnetococcales bacterium]|nr:cysteine synthase A [Magnetococcales bacterium]